MRRAILALAVASLFVAETAFASHLTFDVSLSNYAASASPTITAGINFGTTKPASMTLDFPGWTFAHQSGSSPLSPIPLDGHTVGSGTQSARWQPFCSVPAGNQSMTVKWESTIAPSAPLGTVSQLEFTTPLFTTPAFIVYNGPADYSIVFPDMPDTFVCSGSTWSMTLSLYCSYTLGPTTYYFCRNPSTPGTYQPRVAVTDTSGTSHSTTDGVTIT